MLKNCSLLALAFMLSVTMAAAQGQSSFGDMMGSESHDCDETQSPCKDAQTATSTRMGAADRSLPIDMMRQSPSVIRVNETQTGANRTGQARESVPAREPVIEPPTEFQKFVESSVGKRPPLFGYNLFQGVPSTFAPVDQIAVPANYVIGPGDELLIRAWGQIDVDAHVIVDRNGQIYLPKIGSVSVAGVSYGQLPDHLKASAGLVFRHFDLQVTLGQLRSIQVLVVGYAHRPGTYTVSSLSTLVNALFASGGPSNHGSMRHIEVKRGDKVISDFDMYDLLLKGDKRKDVVLLPGDVIYIPAVGPQVAIVGSVNFPAIYELRGTATLADELEVAGGLSNVADGQRVSLERVENRTTRKVDEFTLDAAGQARELHDSDLVRVFSISPKFENAITLRGNVAEPGRYAFHPGMKVRDLIPNREFLLTRGFWNNQNAAGNISNIDSRKDFGRGLESPKSPMDLATDGKRQDPALDQDQEKNAPLSQRNIGLAEDWHDQSSVAEGQSGLRNNVKRNAPDINWDYAVVQRINPNDLSTTLIPFNLGKAILEGNDSDNVPLQPGDVVTIFSQRDISVSTDHQSKFVRLEGEFHAPGVYKVSPGDTLQSLIARAGGLTEKAFVFGAEFTRESARIQQQASLDQMTRELETEVQHQAVYSAQARTDQQENLQAQAEAQRALVQKMHEVKATGRIVLEIGPTQSGADSFPNIELEDGDSLVVPNKPSTVSVVGAVYNQNSLIFHNNRRVGDYLKLSGGGTGDADMKHLFVIRADGSVLSRVNTSRTWSGGLESMRALAGDTVVVPSRLDKGAGMRAFRDWSQVISQLGLGAAAINVLK
jgi:protein involved in polysaccharide export with SLBB domain